MLSQLVTCGGLLKRSSFPLHIPFTHWHTRSWTTYTQTPDALTIHALNNISFPYIWLRDSCQSSECIHQHSKQKLHRTSDIALDIAPITEESGVKVTAGGIDIVWNDGHKSSFDQTFLERHASSSKLMEWHFDQYLTPECWDRKSVNNLFIPYDRITNTPSALVDAITQLSKYGLLFISGVPNQETSHDKCELRTLAERFGEIRTTFYGAVWDVVNGNNVNRNIAYTDLDLGLHMDLLYFQHPPRYQILHCLRNQVIGGTSIFVDAFHVARQLQESHPRDFDILTKTPVSFHYIVDGHHLHHEHFTIELAPSSISSQLQISNINYAPPFQAPLPLSTPLAFYPALTRFSKMLNDPMNTFEYTLKEGDAVLFDNRRVLHARTAFRDNPDIEMKQGEINRWLKGCYIQTDPLLDKVRVLRARLRLD